MTDITVTVEPVVTDVTINDSTVQVVVESITPTINIYTETSDLEAEITSLNNTTKVYGIAMGHLLGGVI